MAYAARHTDFPALQRPHTAVRPGIWRRIFDAIWYAQQRRAERDIGRYLTRRDGPLTDTLEREIERRMFGDGWGFRR